LNHLEVDDPSVLTIDHVGNVRRSASSMVPTAVDPNDSSLLHLLAIFLANPTIPGTINI
jgi:hypothetical protein